MDAKAKFFARMDASFQAEGKMMEEPALEAEDFDIDFGVSESGRTMVLEKYGGDDSTLGDMDFSMTNSGRLTVEMANTPVVSERSMGTIGTIGDSTIGSISSSILNSTRSVPTNKEEEHVPPQNSTSTAQQPFQPLVPLPERPQRQRSAPRAIPKAAPQVAQSGPPSQSGSAGSTGSAFLDKILNPAASTFNNAQMSHTPPTHVATSYEASHFGKRARSGSISERLRVSSELEEKGMIDREQKGILKDLIISGQDNELQHALDKYEMGDTQHLESMLQDGTLSNRAAEEIDLLGDLDLDFLNVNESEPPPTNAGARHAMQPPPSLPTREQVHQMTGAAPGAAQTATYETSDGIGELDFDGGIGDMDGYAPISTHDRAPSPMYQSHGQRSRSNSTFSMELDYRQRSNSLFSALIGNVSHESTPTDYGQWMQASPDPYRAEGMPIKKPQRRASAPGLPGMGQLAMTPAERRELRAEEKRRERQERKEQKEREKREKKERKELAKLEKQKKAEMEEKEEHQPGSGRPRSMSDPNLKSSHDVNGLLQVERPDGWIGAYSPESRKVRIERFLEKRNHRVWTKTVKYDVRKNFADSRLRVKGRFVKKEDELLMRELMSLT